MKAVIFAGGLGTRFSEKTQYMPKPMIEIGGKPILWHIMKIYSYYGMNDFIICAGYKQHMIKEWFDNYFPLTDIKCIPFSRATLKKVHKQFAKDEN